VNNLGPLGVLILGVIAGFVAGRIQGTGRGFVVDTILGTFGAFLGAFILSQYGAPGVTGFNIWSLGVAIIGALAVLRIARL
jgi:uncharacterized membrane protein YeaQ/YmgE (transglycosylase-associated protein family)